MRALFIGASALSALVAAEARGAAASGTDAEREGGAAKAGEGSKKEAQISPETGRMGDEERAAWQRELGGRIGEDPEELINIHGLWTQETLAVPKNGDIAVGEDIAAEVVDNFFRCHFTDQSTDIDEKLLPVLVRAAKQFDVDRVEIVSAYRSEKHNLNLRKKSRHVARNSQHTHGTAVDFRLPGVHVSRLHRWARSLRLGGVGYYPSSGFVHVDTAEVRYWTLR